MKEPTCPRCHKEKAIISPLYGVILGEQCVAEDRKLRGITHAPEFISLSKQTRIQEQRDRYEKDFLPPYDHNGKPSEHFARAFPDRAKELFGEYTQVTGNEVKL